MKGFFGIPKLETITSFFAIKLRNKAVNFGRKAGVILSADKSAGIPAILISKQLALISVSILLLVLWAALSIFCKLNSWLYIGIIITAVTFVMLSVVLTKLVRPTLTKHIRYFLFFWIIFKIILSVIYFDGFFVERDDRSLEIYQYGDSFTHHNAAVKYFELWNDGKLFEISNSISSQVEQWGYEYFLGSIYFITGPLPETGVIINSFLFLLLCLLSYKIFILTGISQKNSEIGLVFLSLSPLLWLLSSLLYKELLLFVIILISFICILKLTKGYGIKWLLCMLIFQIPLLTLRYSYVFAIDILLLIALFYSRQINLRRRIIVIVICGLFLLAFINFTSHFRMYCYKITDFFKFVSSSMKIPSLGGAFMTKGLGRAITIDNFYYVIPAKAIYILMIPFPWFGGNSLVERIDYICSHIDAFLYLSLLTAVVFTFMQRKRIPLTKEQNLAVLAGIGFLIIPLFMYWPSRRYISICVPFLMAYALPIWSQKKIFLKTASVSIVVILVVQLAYWFTKW